MLKTLILIRHAKSSWDHSGLTDFDRPLNDRGLKDAPQMGERLSSRNIKPDFILSSPALRAKTTAELIAERLNINPDTITYERQLYHASVRTLIEFITDQDDQHQHIMLFGHNPGITYTGEYLTGERLENIPTCGVAGVQFNVKKWSEITEKSGKLLFFDYPKKIVS